MFFPTPIFIALLLNKPYNGTYYFGKPIIDKTKKREEILFFLKEHKNQRYSYNDLMRTVKENNFPTIVGIITVLLRKNQVQVEIENGIKFFSYKEKSL